MTDERGNHPSASGAARYGLCKGSFHAEIAARKLGITEDSKWAQRGNRIHGFCAGEPGVKLNDEEQEVALECLHASAKIYKEWSNGEAGAYWEIEKRIWRFEGNDPDNYSGKPDILYVGPQHRRILILDYKTGREEVEDADINAQLRALVALADANYAPDEITVGIIHPMQRPKYTLAVYDRAAINQAREETDALMWEVQHMQRQRAPHPVACKYCLAKGTPACPESGAVVSEIADVSGFRMLAARLDEYAVLLSKCEIAESVIASIRAQVKALLELGHDVPGWQLKPGNTIEKIVDPVTVMQRTYELGATQDQFLKAVTIAKGKLEEVAREVTGRKGKELKETVDGLIEGCTESKQNAPSLARVKGTKWSRLN